jgi:hypothetical protein
MLERDVGGGGQEMQECYLRGCPEERRGFRARVPVNMLTKGVTCGLQYQDARIRIRVAAAVDGM